MTLNGKEYTLKTRPDGTISLRTALLGKRIFAEYNFENLESAIGDDAKEKKLKEGFIKFCLAILNEPIEEGLDVFDLPNKEIQGLFINFTTALSA